MLGLRIPGLRRPERTLVFCAPGRLGTGTTGTTSEEALRAELGARRIARPHPLPRPRWPGSGAGTGGTSARAAREKPGPGECGGSAPLRAPRQPHSRPIAAGSRGREAGRHGQGPAVPAPPRAARERPARPPALQPAPRRPARGGLRRAGTACAHQRRADISAGLPLTAGVSGAGAHLSCHPQPAVANSPRCGRGGAALPAAEERPPPQVPGARARMCVSPWGAARWVTQGRGNTCATPVARACV